MKRIVFAINYFIINLPLMKIQLQALLHRIVKQPWWTEIHCKSPVNALLVEYFCVDNNALVIEQCIRDDQRIHKPCNQFPFKIIFDGGTSSTLCQCATHTVANSTAIFAESNYCFDRNYFVLWFNWNRETVQRQFLYEFIRICYCWRLLLVSFDVVVVVSTMSLDFIRQFIKSLLLWTCPSIPKQ